MCGIFTSCDAQPVIGTIGAMSAGDPTPVLAFQRIAGNAHELEDLRASVAKIQARLSASEDDDAAMYRSWLSRQARKIREIQEALMLSCPATASAGSQSTTSAALSRLRSLFPNGA